MYTVLKLYTRFPQHIKNTGDFKGHSRAPSLTAATFKIIFQRGSDNLGTHLLRTNSNQLKKKRKRNIFFFNLLFLTSGRAASTSRKITRASYSPHTHLWVLYCYLSICLSVIINSHGWIRYIAAVLGEFVWQNWGPQPKSRSLEKGRDIYSPKEDFLNLVYSKVKVFPP